jgi:hypothetical protein
MRAILWGMDGRLVLLGLIVVIAVVVARDMEPAPTPHERAAVAVLVEVDRVQQCMFRRRERYADSTQSLQLWRGRFMRTAYENELDIQLRTYPGGYAQRVTGAGVALRLERRGAEVLDVPDGVELVSCERGRGRP